MLSCSDTDIEVFKLKCRTEIDIIFNVFTTCFLNMFIYQQVTYMTQVARIFLRGLLSHFFYLTF